MSILKKFEHKIYSQNGEDGIIAFLLDIVGRRNKYYVEFGAADGNECNTRYLREHAGFQGLLMDGGHENLDIDLYQEMIYRDNINELFFKYKVPNEFELLSIDVDGNDLWLWEALDEKYQPRIVIMEFNGALPPPISVTIPYDASHQWDGTSYIGASLGALDILAKKKGYTLVGCDSSGVNSFFIRDDFRETLQKCESIPSLKEAFAPAAHANYCTGGTTRFQINGYTMHSHLKFNQQERQFVEYPSGKPIVIDGIDQGIFLTLEEIGLS
ncbi:hypothetical protein Lepto7376_1952 [[Leptolyngbya] sp. PCC 7376]|uniref:hypothetical protein n=1 Tax=[Leptolyngbya] sp. PCC 7376 TaxID=111781 RepID=UPI00029F3732|nr:hypothetical protein [[Leptolyngbya] sp. PCC 7376]AFY38265.1 hypothetical protein Lepto7376_1952 [[Leptolyngbya] sp. PCC 7376]